MTTTRVILVGLLLSVGVARSDEEVTPLPETVPAPKDNPTTPDKVALGKQLFFDPRLSGDNKMSCATCHLPDKAYADGLPASEGADGKPLKRNTPSVLNTAFFDSLFWDGRSKSLEEQALGPIQAPDEMNQNLAELVKELNGVEGYVTQFQKVFGTPVTDDGIAKALAAFQRTLVTGPSPFDRFLQGDADALSPAAKRGWRLFSGDADCIRCHNGPRLSDGKFHRLGVSWSDPGLGGVTSHDDDKHKFRTPSLRNVAQTAPYMHDGSMKSLDDVVTFYFREVPTSSTQRLDVEPLQALSFSDIADVVAFLNSLTGPYPKAAPPKLP